MVSNHELQKKKLLSNGAYLWTVQDEFNDLHTHVDSITGRMDRVLADTVQFLQDGDAMLSTLGNTFNGSTVTPAGGPTTNEPSFVPNDGPLDERDRETAGSGNTDHPQSAPSEQEPMPNEEVPDDSASRARGIPRQDAPSRNDPSHIYYDAMDHKFPPKRPDKDDNQYFRRHQAHINRINNTQRSWARSGHDVPPHMSSQESRGQNPRQGPETNTADIPQMRASQPRA